MDSNDSNRRLERSLAPRRRQFLLAGAGVGTVVLAGCTATTDSDGDDPTGQDDETDDGQTGDDDGQNDETDDQTGDDESPNFRLLISDMPADIGDFDRLDVSFDSARIFDGGEDDDADDTDSADDSNPEDDEEPADDGNPEDDEETADDSNPEDDEETADDDGAVNEEETDDNPDESVERNRGFYILDLDGATVDLTQVVGDRAMPVFEGKLSEGTYRKIELHVEDIEGIVDGDQAEVKVPSEKLQITTPFEIRADEPVDFVFDINVVKRGQQDRYNLTPVISKSGVAGEDVDVEEVGGEDDSGTNESGDGEADDDGDSGEDAADSNPGNADGAAGGDDEGGTGE